MSILDTSCGKAPAKSNPLSDAFKKLINMEDLKRKKTGGRKKGSLNRTTYEQREHLMQILGICEENLKEDVKSLTPHERLKFWLAVQPYMVPKMAAEKPESDKNECPPSIIFSKEVVHREMNDEERKQYLGE